MRSHFNLEELENLTIDPTTSKLVGIKFIYSPNFDQRPPGVDLSLLVIHSISLPPGKFEVNSSKYIIDLFTNQLDPKLDPYFAEIYSLKVSCHCFISRAGELIQFVPFNARAWHAGESSFANTINCNDFSIGIELEGSDEQPYTFEQYQVLKKLINVIRLHYPKITVDRIVGHADIAPNRKTDPGKFFDWQWVAAEFT